MADVSPGRVLSKKQIEKLAACGKRFELTRDMLKFVPRGTRSLADVAQVGPANIEKCKMTTQEWDRIMKSREDNGQCKGTFFTSFHKTNSFRRCEVAVQPGKSVCDLCRRMREKARKDGLDIVSCDGQPEYKIVQKSLFTRPGVVTSMKLWQDQAEEMKKQHKLQKQFPFFSAQEMVTWLMIEGGAIFSNGGKGGRVYRRSALVVEAQDDYLKDCMQNSLIILRFESKKNFKKRMRKIMSVAEMIKTQMLEANVGSDMFQVGAIQKPDIVREELARAARFMERTKTSAKVFSAYGRRLDEWARERARRAKTGSSPPTSISSSSPSPPKPVRRKANAAKPPLKMTKVQDETTATSAEVQASKTNAANESGEGVAPFKKFEIKKSTIPGAGNGFFLKEVAHHKEAIARYSGKLLSKKEMMQSKSKYIVMISEDKYLCAEGNDEWEGKYFNCARKAGRTVNARFQANGKCNYCKVSKKFYIKVFAVGRIEPGEEALVDYKEDYWCDETGKIEQLPTPKKNYQSDEDDNALSEHSEYKPSGAESADGHDRIGKGVATELNFSSPEKSPDKSEEDSKQKKDGPLRRASRLKLMKVKKEAALKMQQSMQTSSGKEDGEEDSDDEEDSEDKDNGNDEDGNKDEDDDENEDEHDGADAHVDMSNAFSDACDAYANAGNVSGNAGDSYGGGGNRHDGANNGHDNRSNGHGEEEDDGGDNDEQDEEEGGFGNDANGEEEDDGGDKAEQDEDEGELGFRTVAVTPRKVYAVAVGRCVGIFRSAVRMRSSVFRYPGCKYKKFASEADAERFLEEQGVVEPLKYWLGNYPSGTLVQHPHSVDGRDVCFPVGKEMTSKEIRHGVISKPIFRDEWVWEVHMEHGQVDYVSEWPLLCALQLAESREASYMMEPEPASKVNATGARSRRKTRVKGSTPLMTDTREGRHKKTKEREPQVFYAVRGTRKKGIVTNIGDAFARMVGSDAEYEEFDTRREAQQWIDELHQVWAVRFANGKTQIVKMSDIKQVTRGQRGIRIVGPTSKTQAQKTVATWKEEMGTRERETRRKEAKQVIDMTGQDACIARMKDGSVCGRKVNITQTLLGPLCGEHVELYRGDDARKDEDERKNKKGEVEGRDSTEIPNARRVVQKSQPQETEQLMSPDEGVLLPAKKAALQRDRSGLHSVVAVRTFADKEVGTRPAGSVWLSLDKASMANGKKGEMKVFDSHEDIFMNMEEAKTWVEAQVQADSESELESEAERRWQEAQEKAKNDRKKKKEENRKKGSNKSQKPPKRVNKKKESESKDEDEEEDEQSADEPLEGASRRFRRSRRRRRESRGGLRSGALKMLDKQQKRIEEQLFPDNALEVVIYEEAVPEIKLIQKIPLPGKAQALTVGKDAGHVLSFANDMKAVLAERTFKSFNAFSLSDLLEFQQVVDYVASYQPAENKRVTDSVVEGVKVIVNNAVSLHATMRDSDSLGAYGENFKADTYLQVMCLVMFREVYEGSLAELFFWNYAPKFAVKARGCPGMAPWKDPKLATNSERGKSKDRCLLCGKTGHRADSDVHKQELAEGSRSTSPDQLQSALAQVAQDSSLSAEQKKLWSSRIRGFWGKLSAKDRDSSDL